MALFDHLHEYIESQLRPELERYASLWSARNKKTLEVCLSDDYRMQAHIVTKAYGYQVIIARGWLVRVGIAITLIDTLWATIQSRPNVLAVNINSVFDDYFHAIQCDSAFNFSAVPDLAPIFVDIGSDEQLEGKARSFEADFNARSGGGTGILNFHLPSTPTEASLAQFNTCTKFLLFHEIAHAECNHQILLGRNTFSALREIPDFSATRNPYLKKALEVDADTRALEILLDEAMRSAIFIDYRSILLQVFKPVFLMLSLFDIGRRNIHPYQGKFATHPLPEVRAIAASLNIAPKLSAYGVVLTDLVVQCRDQAMIHCIESFQRLGVPAGAFYIAGNSYVCLDEQFTSELAVVAIIRDELENIHIEYRRVAASSGKKAPPWTYHPLGRDMAEIREAATKAALMIFRKENQNPNIDDILQARFATAKARLGPGPGHLVMTSLPPTVKDSPFFKRNYWDEPVESDRYASKELQAQYERIMGSLLALLFHYAEARIVSDE